MKMFDAYEKVNHRGGWKFYFRGNKFAVPSKKYLKYYLGKHCMKQRDLAKMAHLSGIFHKRLRRL